MDEKMNYKKIYHILKEDILNEKYAAGSLLPTEQTLADEYQVSRPTIAKVYNKLQQEGYIRKKKGFGTMVIHNYVSTTKTFGLLLPGAGESEIFSIINDRLLEESRNGTFNCLWDGATASSAEIRKTLIDTCCDNYIKAKVDGIFFSPLERVRDADYLNREICKRISDAGIPVVLIDRDILKFPERSPYDVVCLDNFSAGSIMATHLIEAGCDTIYFFHRPDSAHSVHLRLAGVKDAVQERRLKFDRDHVFCGQPEDIAFVRKIHINNRRTGIVCANDSTAAVLMSTLETVGVKVCSDVLICGYDNMRYSEHLKYSLTSFKQPCEEIADVSLELMMRKVENRNAIPLTVNLTGEIIVRESTSFKKR
ncbi:MAG: LacI family transcriptional regulator [Tannerellaceae bacterium]|nr:LacI family transcriptional regulator [Tannerellaceae bacterium]